MNYEKLTDGELEMLTQVYLGRQQGLDMAMEIFSHLTWDKEEGKNVQTLYETYEEVSENYQRLENEIRRRKEEKENELPKKN